jgi:DNA polymerase III delta subunit
VEARNYMRIKLRLIKHILSKKKYTIEPKAVAMLVEFLGTNLSKINNELEKLKSFYQ